MKTLASVILLLATVCPSSHGGGNRTDSGSDEKEHAAKAVEAAGGGLTLAEGNGPKKYNGLRLSRGADVAAVMRAIGPLRDLRVISFNNVPITDEHLKGLSDLPDLRTLTLIKLDKITDDGIKQIAAHKMLGSLTVMDCKIGDGAMSAVGNLRELQHLNLTGTLVTDKGLKDLVGLKKVETLWVGPNIADAGLMEIGKLKTLTSVVLRGTAVTGRGLKKLAAIEKLAGLNLLDSKVGDDDLSVLAGFPNLAGLVLEGTKVTDAGMGHLVACKHLRSLEIARTQVSDLGIFALADVPELKSLGCAGTNVTRDGIKILQGLRVDIMVSDR